MKKLVLSIILLMPALLFASHYMGGEITWQCLTNGHYRFILKLYRECNGITYSQTETLNSTSPAGNISMTLFPGGNPRDSEDGLLDGKTDLSPDCWNFSQEIHCTPSPGTPNTGAIEEWYYTSDAAYPAGVILSGVPPANGWEFFHTSCCRNPCTNISNASSLDWHLRTIMYPYCGQNADPCYDNSPEFAEVSAPVGCSGYPYTYFNIGKDKEYDSLSYEWAPAVSAGQYSPGYSYNQPLLGVMLDSTNGDMTDFSSNNGAFVIVIKLSEYRNGIKIGEVFRENQIVLLAPLGQDNPPSMSAPFANPVSGLYDSWEDTINIGESVNANMSAIDMDFLPNGDPNAVTMEIFGEYFGTNFSDPSSGCPYPPCATMNPPPPLSGLVAVSANFNWNTDCSQVSDWIASNREMYFDSIYYYFPFYFTVRAQDNYCPVPFLANEKMTIVVRLGPFLDHPVLDCTETDSAGNVTIHWEPPFDPDSGFYSYLIYRSLHSSGPFQPIQAIYNFNQTSFTDYWINPNSNYQYFYKIKTYSGCNGLFSRDGFSNIVSTTKVILNITYGGPLMLSWNLSGTIQINNPWYIVYMQCNGQSWQLLDSTQQTFYFLNDPDSVYENCQFMIRVTDSYGCTDASSTIYYGIDESYSAAYDCLELFPNPASDKIYIRHPSNGITSAIGFFDVFGRKYDVTIISHDAGNLSIIDVSALPPGLYYLKKSGCAEVEKLMILR